MEFSEQQEIHHEMVVVLNSIIEKSVESLMMNEREG